MKYSFQKNERITLKKVIDALFDRKSKNTESFLVFPIKTIFITPTENLQKTQILISVSSKKFKNATDRNLIKRRMREAYRLNKALLTKCYFITFIYVGVGIENYSFIENALKKSLLKINEMNPL